MRARDPAAAIRRVQTELRARYDHRMARQPTRAQRLWRRWHRIVVLLAALGMLLTLVLGEFGGAAVLFAVTLGLGAFAGGPPSDNGSTRAPPRMYG